MIKEGFVVEYLEFIIENIRDEDFQEMQALWGISWKKEMMNSLMNTNCIFSMAQNKSGKIIPIAVGGFQKVFPSNPKIACVWLISSAFVKENKKEFFKDISFILEKASTEYSIFYNFIYKSNYEAKNWLKKFGFKFDNPNPKNIYVAPNFEFFYKTN